MHDEVNEPQPSEDSAAQSMDSPVGNETSPDAQRRERLKRYMDAIFNGKNDDIKKSFCEMADSILARFPEISNRYHILVLLEPQNSVDSADLNGLFGSLRRENNEKEKDVLLLLLSRGGAIEPAYQISKICKAYAHEKFVVSIPRYAKSAATLIALGADEIHIGPLGELGPIDPQLGGLPALGVGQALKTIASVSQAYPGSAAMFAAYLKEILTVEQIGYCDRIAESAVQYAQRLLTTKASTEDRAETIARKLVHEFKDHGFVIDRDEARQLLGGDLIMEGTPELEFSEEVYSLFDESNFLLEARQKRLIVAGDWRNNVIVLNRKKR